MAAGTAPLDKTARDTVPKGEDRADAPPVRRVRRVQQRSTDTRRRLLAAARDVFARNGYHATATSDLVELSSVSRGALYHHFSDKEAIFEAVLREVALELRQDATDAVAAYAGDPWRQLKVSLQRYMEFVAVRPEAQRIVLIDGPAVLGWERWRSIRAEINMPGLVTNLGMLMDQHIVASQPKEPLAQLILAAMNEAALAIAHAPKPTRTEKLMTRALLNLIEGLKGDRGLR